MVFLSASTWQWVAIKGTPGSGRLYLNPTPLCSALQPFTIVGGGRVGQALAGMGAGTDAVVRRGEAVEGPPGPIVVCTRNDDLQAVLDATPADRRKGAWAWMWCTVSVYVSGDSCWGLSMLLTC